MTTPGDMSSELRYLYFAYGTGLSHEHMTGKYKSAEYAGVARIVGYRWFMSKYRCANIRPVNDDGSLSLDIASGGASGSASASQTSGTVVWGVAYWIDPAREPADKPHGGGGPGYKKERFSVEYWATGNSSSRSSISSPSSSASITIPDSLAKDLPGEKTTMFLYHNPDCIEELREGVSEDYHNKMKLGIQDALKAGVPEEYLQKDVMAYVKLKVKDNEKKNKHTKNPKPWGRSWRPM